jgi:16S rRNA pseudouridine516 synthase
MLNKPQGVVSATFDPHKETVIDLVNEYASYKIFPVGRLDIDTTGLLLITNDGILCHKMLSPKSHVDKKYYVEFSGEFKEEYYEKFEKGITLDDGYLTLPANIKLVGEQKAIVTIHEGKFHQVKRMFLALNMEVTYLRRITFGPLSIDENLKEGEYRLLSEEEIDVLNKLYE